MSKELTTSKTPVTVPEAIEKALMMGDLSALTVEQRVSYYNRVCESVGLNSLTKPFDFMKTQTGALQLYANKNCAEQLRRVLGISISIVAREKVDSLYIVTARGVIANGRQDESLAAVDLKGLSGERLANAIMKCETKAKRRVTLSIVGLGMLDETEIHDNPQAFKLASIDAPVGAGLKAPGSNGVDVAADEPERVYEIPYRVDGYDMEPVRMALKGQGFRFDGQKKAWVGCGKVQEAEDFLEFNRKLSDDFPDEFFSEDGSVLTD